MSIDDLPQTDSVMMAQFLASEYHSGQWSALYALASSGSLELYSGEGISRLVREVDDAINVAYDNNMTEDYCYLVDFASVLDDVFNSSEELV